MKKILNFTLFLFLLCNVFSQSINYPFGKIYLYKENIHTKYFSNIYVNGIWLDNIIIFSFENYYNRDFVQNHKIKEIISTRTPFIIKNNDTIDNNNSINTRYLFNKDGNLVEIVTQNEYYSIKYKDSLIDTIFYNDSVNIAFIYDYNQNISKIDVYCNNKLETVEFLYNQENLTKMNIWRNEKIIFERVINCKETDEYENVAIYDNGKLYRDFEIYPNNYKITDKVGNTTEFNYNNTYELYSPLNNVYERKIYNNGVLIERYFFNFNSTSFSSFSYKNKLISKVTVNCKNLYDEHFFNVINFKYIYF